MEGARLLARFSAGPAWAEGGSPREQPDWEAHGEFVDRLVAEGVMLMGGPLQDNSGALMLFEGLSETELREQLAVDPFVENGVFVLEEILEWRTYVG